MQPGRLIPHPHVSLAICPGTAEWFYVYIAFRAWRGARRDRPLSHRRAICRKTS